MAIVDDRDLWDDEDLLIFEEPSQRAKVAARMRRADRLPGNVVAARALMYLQAASPLLVPILAVARNNGALGEDDAAATATATTTTTTTAAVADQAARQGGRAGAFLIFALLFLITVGLLLLFATRLRRLTKGTRNAAVAFEVFILLVNLRGALAGGTFGLVAVSSAIGILVLLLLPTTGRAIVAAGTKDTAARFDIRTLPEFDR